VPPQGKSLAGDTELSVKPESFPLRTSYIGPGQAVVQPQLPPQMRSYTNPNQVVVQPPSQPPLAPYTDPRQAAMQPPSTPRGTFTDPRQLAVPMTPPQSVMSVGQSASISIPAVEAYKQPRRVGKRRLLTMIIVCVSLW